MKNVQKLNVIEILKLFYFFLFILFEEFEAIIFMHALSHNQIPCRLLQWFFDKQQQKQQI